MQGEKSGTVDRVIFFQRNTPLRTRESRSGDPSSISAPSQPCCRDALGNPQPSAVGPIPGVETSRVDIPEIKLRRARGIFYRKTRCCVKEKLFKNMKEKKAAEQSSRL